MPNRAHRGSAPVTEPFTVTGLPWIKLMQDSVEFFQKQGRAHETARIGRLPVPTGSRRFPDVDTMCRRRSEACLFLASPGRASVARHWQNDLGHWEVVIPQHGPEIRRGRSQECPGLSRSERAGHCACRPLTACVSDSLGFRGFLIVCDAVPRVVA